MQGTSEIYVRVPVSLKAWLQDYAARIDSNQKQIVVDKRGRLEVLVGGRLKIKQRRRNK